MKTILLVALTSLLVANTYGQGRISFQNDNVTSPIRVGGRLASGGDGIRVALYWAPLSNPNQFVQLGNSAAVGVPVPGQFVGGTRTTGIATSPGQDAMFIVRAWELAFGATYEAAVAAPPVNGRVSCRAESPPFRLTTPASDLLPPVSIVGTPSLPGFTGFNLPAQCPEPSSVILGATGLGLLLLFRRKP